MRPVEGMCDSLAGRYYFNPDTADCEEFKDMLCADSNGNNFPSLETCRSFCSKYMYSINISGYTFRGRRATVFIFAFHFKRSPRGQKVKAGLLISQVFIFVQYIKASTLIETYSKKI